MDLYAGLRVKSCTHRMLFDIYFIIFIETSKVQQQFYIRAGTCE